MWFNQTVAAAGCKLANHVHSLERSEDGYRNSFQADTISHCTKYAMHRMRHFKLQSGSSFRLPKPRHTSARQLTQSKAFQSAEAAARQQTA
jgi:hypothetical protein